MSSVTKRDEIWATVLENGARAGATQVTKGFTVSDVQKWMREEDRDPPSERTIKRALRAMSELGAAEHESGSPYWHVAGKWRAKW